jgi:hypothetical protein
MCGQSPRSLNRWRSIDVQPLSGPERPFQTLAPILSLLLTQYFAIDSSSHKPQAVAKRTSLSLAESTKDCRSPEPIRTTTRRLEGCSEAADLCHCSVCSISDKCLVLSLWAIPAADAAADFVAPGFSSSEASIATDSSGPKSEVPAMVQRGFDHFVIETHFTTHIYIQKHTH